MRIRALGATAGAMTLLLTGVTMPSAQALPTDEFDAPLLGFTASEQLTRMPSLDEVQCSDAACTTGLFPRAALTLTEYSTSSIMPDAGYARVPEFRRGVNELWRDLTVRKGDTSIASFTIAEYQPGSDMRKVMADTAAQTGTPLTERIVNGTSVFVGETVNASESDNNFSGTAFKSAYVLGTDSLVRAGCQAGGTGVQTSRCTVENLIPLAIAIANKAPARAIPGASRLAKLAPQPLPADLQPLIVNSTGGDQPWAIDISNPKLLAALRGKPTASAQYTIEGSPRMHVFSQSTELANPRLALGYVKRPCSVTVEGASCRDRLLPGGLGMVTTYIDDTATGEVGQIEIRGIGKRSLIDFGCFKRGAVSGYLTKQEIARCTALGRTILENAQR